MRSELTLIPKVTIHPGKIVTYQESFWDPVKPSRACKGRSEAQAEIVEKHLKNSKRSALGLVSPTARKKMATAMDYLFLMAKPTKQYNKYTGQWFTMRTAFITLTLPAKQIHSDNDIKKYCLNQLLIELRDKFKVRNYVWRAEKQANGNIHFHILMDKFIFHTLLRDRWNRIIEKLGYVSAYRKDKQEFFKDGFRPRPELFVRLDKLTGQICEAWTLKKQIKAYEKGVTENWSNPNTVDIHSVQFIRNIKGYVMKYLEKNPNLPDQPSEDATDQEKQIYQDKLNALLVQGRLWGSNEDLSLIKGCTVDVDSHIDKELTELIQQTKCHRKIDTYYSIYYINFGKLSKKMTPNLYQYFIDYLLQQFHYDYNTKEYQPQNLLL